MNVIVTEQLWDTWTEAERLRVLDPPLGTTIDFPHDLYHKILQTGTDAEKRAAAEELETIRLAGDVEGCSICETRVQPWISEEHKAEIGLSVTQL